MFLPNKTILKRYTTKYNRFLSHCLSNIYDHTLPTRKPTIYGLATGPIIKSGVAVIRISGPESKACLQELLANQSKFPSARMASLRKLYCPINQQMKQNRNYDNINASPLDVSKSQSHRNKRILIDNALVLYFNKPHSFTGEDVVELHIHGSKAVVNGLLHAFECMARPDYQRIHLKVHGEGMSAPGPINIRAAERGEFTRNAFENGKLSLVEVEGLSDLLDADTAYQRVQALNQIEGHFKDQLYMWKDTLMKALAYMEAVIDFGDDERGEDESLWNMQNSETETDGMSEVSGAHVLDPIYPQLEKLRNEIQHVLHSYKKGELIRTGVRVVLVGRPNAGKSSLLNMLAQRPAAIVSDVPGTTRDLIEVKMDMKGIPCVLTDTAGLRIKKQNQKRAQHEEMQTNLTDKEEETAIGCDMSEYRDVIDVVELEGMKRARNAYSSSELKVLLIDAPDKGLVNESYVEGIVLMMWELLQLLPVQKSCISHRNNTIMLVFNKMDTLFAQDTMALPVDYQTILIKTLQEKLIQYHNSMNLSHNDCNRKANSETGSISDIEAHYGVKFHYNFISCTHQSQYGWTDFEKDLHQCVYNIVHSHPYANDNTKPMYQHGEYSGQGLNHACPLDSISASNILEGDDDITITRERHKQLLMSCVGHLNNVLTNASLKRETVDEMPLGKHLEDEFDFDVHVHSGLEITAEELRLAMMDIGRILGRVDVEELLEIIFRDFCIGK